MKSKVKAFVEFRFDHLIKKNILNSYIIIMLFNIILISLSKGIGEQILFGAMLFFFIILSYRVLKTVKKLMMRTYLYKGIVSIYLNMLFTITFYYVITIGQQHDFKILFFLFIIAIYFNVVNYILAKYYIKKGRYAKGKIKIKYKLSLKKGILLFVFIILARVVSMQYINISFYHSLIVLYFIFLVFTFYFMFIFNKVNLQLLKAYYINKFDLEKDECIDLAERLSRC